MKSKRIKPQPLQSAEEFFAIVDALVKLEATKRKYEAARDLALQRVNAAFDLKLAPVLAEIKGKLALAGPFAEANRKTLLPPKLKSTVRGLARFGFRDGNRKVELRNGVTVEHAINALKALGITDYVAKKEEIAKAKILTDCKDDETLSVRDPGAELETWRSVPLANAGLRITQGEGFYIEPASDAANTLKPSENAA